MCKVTMLRELVKLKLHVAVEEIFELFEKTIAEYEEEFRRTKEARKRRRDEEPDAVLKPRARLRKDVRPASEDSEEEEEVPSGERGEPPAKKPMTEERMTLRTSQRKTTQANGERREDPRPPPDYLAPISDTEGMASDSDNSDGVCRAKQTKKSSECRDCGKMFARKEDLDRRVKTHIGKKPCNSPAVTQASAAKVPSFTCSVCKKSFPSQDDLKSHARTHAEEKAVPSGSSTRAGGQSGKDLHPQRDRSAPVSNTDNATSACDRERDAKGPSKRKKSKCSLCGETFARKRDLKRHARTHAGNQPLNGATPSDGVKSFTCSVCAKSFTGRDLLISHIRQAHATEEKTAAPASPSDRVASKSKKLRSRPDKSSATVAKPPGADEYFACSFCPKTFATADFLMSHERTHNEEKPPSSGHRAVAESQELDSQADKSMPVAKPSVRSFSCSVCMKNLSSRDLLVWHEQAQHTNEKAAAAGVSPQRGTAENQNLRSRPDNLAAVSKPGEAEKYFPCSFCPKIFTTGDFLKSHERTHTEEKTVTSASSSQRRASQSQKRLRSPPNKLAAAPEPSEPDEYFDCPLCPKSFTTRDFLTSHLQTHAEEKSGSRQCLASDAQKPRSRPNKSPPAADKDDVTSDSSDDGAQKSLDANKKRSENGEVFVHKAYLDDHRKTQIGKKALSRAGVTKLFLTVKSLPCSVCANTFASKDSLVAHMRAHKVPTWARPGGRATTEETGPEGLLAPLSDSDVTSDSSQDDLADDGVSVMTTRNS